MALIETKPAPGAMTRGSFTQSTGRSSTAGLLVEEVVEPPGAEGERGDDLAGARRTLRTPVTTPRSTRSMTPSESSSVWMPRSRWPREAASTPLGIEPMPTWMRGPVGDALGDERGDGVVDVVGRAPGRPRPAAGRPRTNPRPGRGGPGCARRAGHLRVGLEEERDPADERRHVVGVGAEARSSRGGPAVAAAATTERPRRSRAQQARHLAEVAGTSSTAAARGTRGRVTARGSSDTWRGGRRRRRRGRAGRAARASGAPARPRSPSAGAAASRASSTVTGSPLASGTMTSAPSGRRGRAPPRADQRRVSSRDQCDRSRALFVGFRAAR